MVDFNGKCNGAVMLTGIIHVNVQNYSRHRLYCSSSPVLLADKQIEGVLRPQEVVVIQNFHCTHPVRIEVTGNLKQIIKKQNKQT